MNILVTGVIDFIGHHLVNILLGSDKEITIYSCVKGMDAVYHLAGILDR